MKVFLINIDKDVERLAAASEQLAKYDVAFERLPAVYAKEFSLEKQNSYINQWRWWLAVGRHWRPGEIGCALSHYTIYDKMINENIPVACVLEDDVLLLGNLKTRLEALSSWMDETRPQVVLLSCHIQQGSDKEEVVPAKADMFTEAYVITRPAAEALLKANLPMISPCDHWRRWVKLGLIELYHSFPTIAKQDLQNFSSNIGLPIGKLPRRPLLERLVRHFGFIVDDIILTLEAL